MLPGFVSKFAASLFTEDITGVGVDLVHPKTNISAETKLFSNLKPALSHLKINLGKT